MRKTNRAWPKCNQFQKWSAYINMSNFKPFLACVLTKILKTPHLTCFMKSRVHQNEENQVSDQNAIFCEGRQNTSEYINIPNVRSFVPCVLYEILKSQIWPVSWSQNCTKMRKIKCVTKMQSFLKVVRIHQNTSTHQMLGPSSYAF